MSAPAKKVIPATKLYHRYRFFEHTSKRERRAQAEYFANDEPTELANQFRASVVHFEPYENIDEHFLDKAHAVELPSPGRATSTKEVANRVCAAGTVLPRERDGGRRGSAPSGPVSCPRAEHLAFDYVERELNVTRTTNGRWEHGAAGRSRLDLDLLLASHADRTPIAAEVKIRDDADRYYALVQTLAALACLATTSQCARLLKHLSDRGRFHASLVEAPRLDLFLLFVDPDIRGGPQERIETAVDKLASQLLHFDPVAWSIRRIVALEVDSHDGLDASVRFAYERAERPRTPLH